MSSRQYPDRPMVGVGGVVLKGDSVLLVKRGKPPAAGKWSIPGGLVKVGESLTMAVKREVLEETGITVKPVGIVAVLDRIIWDFNGSVQYHYILVDFLCLPEEGLEPNSGSDAVESRYVPFEDLGSLDMTLGTKEVIEKARKGILDRDLYFELKIV
ncbi:MAG: NUDIX hydrolase [Deltaproteobacteria bacterium]|nr:NUDIX hydrolase [Deltaproteobacteria bacterium]MBW2069110.1 NUDIX hydrolase [Deltaproteobacteria bacterium]